MASMAAGPPTLHMVAVGLALGRSYMISYSIGDEEVDW